MKDKIILPLILGVLLSVTNSAWAVDKDDDRVYPPYAQPDTSHVAVTGPEVKDDDFTGPEKRITGFYGPDDSHATPTGREYKIPECDGVIYALTPGYITLMRKVGKSTFYHSFIINARTKVTGDIKKGAPVNISYDIGTQKNANRNATTMTAIEIKVIDDSR